jgi:hypothetical protein
MGESIIVFVLFAMFVSPLIFLYLKQKRIAIINSLFLITYVVLWIKSVQYKGTDTINIIGISWITSLIILILFFLIGYSIIIKNVFTLEKSTLFFYSAISFCITLLLFILSRDKPILSLVDSIMVFFVPIYMLSILISGFVKMKVLSYKVKKN